jgi:hypothetical protein
MAPHPTLRVSTIDMPPQMSAVGVASKSFHRFMIEFSPQDHDHLLVLRLLQYGSVVEANSLLKTLGYRRVLSGKHFDEDDQEYLDRVVHILQCMVDADVE